MVQRCYRARLEAEVRQPRRVSREPGAKSLDGDVAAEIAVVRSINLAHAASAQKRHDMIGPELPAQQPPAGADRVCDVGRPRLLKVMCQLRNLARKLFMYF